MASAASIILAVLVGGIATVAFLIWRLIASDSALAGLPSLGYFTSLKAMIGNSNPYNERYEQSRSRLSLSDRKLYTVWMPWGKRMLTGTSPTLVRELFDMHKFSKFEMTLSRETFLGTLMGRNIATVNGDEWQLHRSITRPAFARPLKMGAFVDETRKVLALLRQHAKRTAEKSEKHQIGAIDVYSLMQRLTLSVLGFGIFSFDFESLPRLESVDTVEDYSTLRAGPYVEMYNTIMTEIMYPVYFFFPLLCKLPIPSVQETWRKVNAFSTLLRSMVEKRKEDLSRNRAEGITLDPKKMDLLDMMVEAAFEDEATSKWTTENMMHNLFTFFLAGHDTTSNALSCALYHLAAYPEVQTKARDEVFSVFGTPSTFEEALFMGQDEPVTQMQLGRLSLLNAVIRETMRLYPSATQPVMRVASTDVSIQVPLGSEPGCAVKDIHIPKGTMAAIDIWGMHHDPDNFEEPDKFKPERWVNSSGTTNPDGDARLGSWSPFGGGARICMGMQFSLVEQRVLLMMALRAFTIELSPNPEQQKLVLSPSGLLHPIGLELVFKPRHA